MALARPSWNDELVTGADLGGTSAPKALAFMPRLWVLTTLPHRRPQDKRFERVNGWQSLRMVAPRRIGLPYGVYPRLLLLFIATEAVRKKSQETHLGTSPRALARKLGLSVVSGPRGTARRLEAQLWFTSISEQSITSKAHRYRSTSTHGSPTA